MASDDEGSKKPLNRAINDAVTASQERLKTDYTDYRQGTMKSIGDKSGDEEAPLVSKNGTVDKSTKTSRSCNTVVCEVVLPDGSICDVEITTNANGQQLFDKVCEKLNLLEREYFSCTYQIRDVKFWLKMDKQVKKQIKGGPWKFSFEVKFYPIDPTSLHEELTRYQLYLQVREDICTGRLPCSFVTLVLLGSYAAMSQLGDWDADEHGPGIDYIKKVRFAPTQTEELLERIAELHRTHRGQSPGEAEYHYLENAKNMALYGVHLHQATYVSGQYINQLVNIGVCAAGLVIYQDRIRIHRFVWAKIIKFSYKRNFFMVQVRPTTSECSAMDVIHKFKLENITMAKKLWRLAVEHHAFFRLREPERDTKKRFSRIGSKYRYTGRTQFQSQQAAEQISRSTQDVVRVTGERFTWDRTLDPGTPGTSIDRSEEVVMEGYRTATLDLKRRNKNSVPFADGEDDTNGPFKDQDFNDGSRAYLVAGTVGNESVVAYQKSTHPSTSSMGEVFLTLNSQRRPSQDDHLQTGQRRTPDSYGAGSFENVNYAGRTPYPGPDIIASYHTPGLTGDEPEGLQPGYSYQDDHLKVHGVGVDVSGGQGGWSTTMTQRTVTTKTYTAPDGTLVTEHRTEKDGIVETRIEKRSRSVDIDHDQALAEAIFAVTEMNPDMSVEKIEIHTKSDD